MSAEGIYPENPRPSWQGLVIVGLTVAAGVLVGRYAGLFLLIPFALAGLAGWSLIRSVTPENRPMVPASAILSGQALWMVLIVWISRANSAELLDVAILLGGAAWLAYQPSKLAGGLMIAFQTLGIAFNGYLIAGAEWSTPVYKALLVHLIFRVASVIAIVVGLRRVGRPPVPSETAST